MKVKELTITSFSIQIKIGKQENIKIFPGLEKMWARRSTR
jgi:hypothetical protein